MDSPSLCLATRRANPNGCTLKDIKSKLPICGDGHWHLLCSKDSWTSHWGDALLVNRVSNIRGPKIKELSIGEAYRASNLRTSGGTFLSKPHRVNITYNRLLFALAGMIYGGLHALAWNAPFPSQTQMMLWKISCMTLVATGPVIWLMNRAQEINVATCHLDFILYVFFQHFIVYAVVALYVVSRASLVVECFIVISYFPFSVFETPRWSKYFPHIS